MNCDLLKPPIENHIKHFVYEDETHQLTQLINKPTRITPSSRSLIDMIMTTNPDKILDCLVYCVSSFKSQSPTQCHRTIEMRKFKVFNINVFLLDFGQCPCTSVEEFEDVDQAFQAWKKPFTQVCDKYCHFVTRHVRKTFCHG